MLNTFQIQHSEIFKFFFKRIYLCPLLYSAPWVNYYSEKDSVMSYTPPFFIENHLLIVISKYWQEVKIKN
jgi:hypothetical protein